MTKTNTKSINTGIIVVSLIVFAVIFRILGNSGIYPITCGLLNLYSHIANLGGTMEIQSNPQFELNVTLPKIKEGTE